MTKAELLRILASFRDDVEIYVGGCEPVVEYVSPPDYPAHINLESEGWMGEYDGTGTETVRLNP